MGWIDFVLVGGEFYNFIDKGKYRFEDADMCGDSIHVMEGIRGLKLRNKRRVRVVAYM